MQHVDRTIVKMKRSLDDLTGYPLPPHKPLRSRMRRAAHRRLLLSQRRSIRPLMPRHRNYCVPTGWAENPTASQSIYHIHSVETAEVCVADIRSLSVVAPHQARISFMDLDKLFEVFDPEADKAGRALIVEAIDSHAPCFGIHFESDIRQPILILAQHRCDPGDGNVRAGCRQYRIISMPDDEGGFSAFHALGRVFECRPG